MDEDEVADRRAERILLGEEISSSEEEGTEETEQRKYVLFILLLLCKGRRFLTCYKL